MSRGKTTTAMRSLLQRHEVSLSAINFSLRSGSNRRHTARLRAKQSSAPLRKSKSLR